MNIDEEFARFIEFPECSSGLYVTTVSAKLFAEHCIEQLKQDRDQLKAEVEALKPYKDNHIDLMHHMAVHDSEVIERVAIELKEEFPHHTGVYHWLIGLADELRQKAQVTK